MGKINILHVSDLHFDLSGQKDIRKLLVKLCSDINKIQQEKEIKIDLVCFSGDLIHDGQNAINGEGQLALAQKEFIEPLLKELRIDKDKFYIVPGNHEVDTSKVNSVIEKGFDGISVEEIWDSFDNSFKDRLSDFYSMIDKWHPEAYRGKLGYSTVVDINGIKAGIACVDSAWRSSGKGRIERGRMLVCREQIEELYDLISETDVKICILHHPLDWIKDEEFRAISKELAKFDLVLNGHVHETDTNAIISNTGNTIYSTAGKLYPFDKMYGDIIDGFNGYSIISYDIDFGLCNMYIRTYYGRTRDDFGPAENIVPNGEKTFKLESFNEDRMLEYDILDGVHNSLSRMFDKLAYVKTIDGKTYTNTEDLIIEPTLSKMSDYVRENEKKDSATSIDEIMTDGANHILIGKKESGKTTILQSIGFRYISQFNKFGKIPVYVDAKRMKKGSDKLFMSSFLSIVEAGEAKLSLSKQKYVEFLKSGKIVLLVDNLDTNSSDMILQVSKFRSEYPDTRFYITIEEDFFHSVDIKELPETLSDFASVYIQNFGKNQVRQLVTRWSGENTDRTNQLATKIDSYCNKINLAKTPFNISIFMLIWDYDSNNIPTNEGILMENYLQIILEKLSSDEANRSNFSFAIKEDFLANFAYYLYSQEKCFYISQEHFLEFVAAYHEKKGYSVSDTTFDTLFFEKNILVLSEGFVSFSRTSFLEFFLAIYARKDERFLDEMLEDGKRQYFRNEICFFAGLNNDCKELLDKLSEKVIYTIIDNLDLIDGLNDLEILTEFKLDKDEFLQDVTETRPSIEEVDSMSDDAYEYREESPKEIHKCDSANNDAAYDFISTMQIYGGVLKNAELLDNTYKIKHLENYMYGMNMLYAIMIQLLRELKDSISYEDLDETQKEKLDVSSADEYNMFKERMFELSKMAFPLAVQRLILENVGTPKLKAAIDYLIKQKDNCPFEKFMLTFLKADLREIGIRKDLKPYIKAEKSTSILKLIHMKLTYYYQMHFFSKELDNEILDLLSETTLILNDSKKWNSSISQGAKKSIVAKLLREERDNSSRGIV